MPGTNKRNCGWRGWDEWLEGKLVEVEESAWKSGIQPAFTPAATNADPAQSVRAGDGVEVRIEKKRKAPLFALKSVAQKAGLASRQQ